MQGKKSVIPYTSWIAALAFDTLIVIDRYPMALILFLPLTYSCYSLLQQKQAGIRAMSHGLVGQSAHLAGAFEQVIGLPVLLVR